MKKIYSKVEEDILLHIICRKSDFVDKRTNVVDSEEFIQCAIMKLNAGQTFRPHKHVWKHFVSEYGGDTAKAQESWVVIRGKVKCIFYDVNDEIIYTAVLEEGDASFTLHGGHNYEVLMDNTMVYEYKTGPYTGQENDKKFID